MKADIPDMGIEQDKYLQVITNHTVTITVQEGEVGSAIMDDKWDMIRQELVESNSEDKNCL